MSYVAKSKTLVQRKIFLTNSDKTTAPSTVKMLRFWTGRPWQTVHKGSILLVISSASFGDITFNME